MIYDFEHYGTVCRLGDVVAVNRHFIGLGVWVPAPNCF